jgi:predicted RNA-binding Zn-ribbon protein involved in translation (DUF1610 family)
VDTRKMKVITAEEAIGQTRFKLGPDARLFIRGHGDLSFECGSCGKTLLRDLEYKQIQDVVYICHCGAHNVIPITHHSH